MTPAHAAEYAVGSQGERIHDPDHAQRVLPAAFLQLPAQPLAFSLSHIAGVKAQGFLAGRAAFLDGLVRVAASGQRRLSAFLPAASGDSGTGRARPNCCPALSGKPVWWFVWSTLV